MSRKKISSVRFLLIAGQITFSGWGCYYDSVEELYPISSKSCDTSNISYSETVEPFMRNNCYGCHANGVGLGGVTLEGITNLRTYANSGQLTGALEHKPGFAAMPPASSKTDDCTIQKINSWIRSGTPAN